MKIIKKTYYILTLFFPTIVFGFSVTISNKSNYDYHKFVICIYPVRFDASYGREEIDKVVKSGQEISINVEQTLSNTPATLKTIPTDANLNINVFAVSADSPKCIQVVEKKSALVAKEIAKIDKGWGFKLPDINIYIDENDNMIVITSTLILA